MSTARIRPLPAFLIDQIKAGEVIERPSSLLKELIENSIDANATSISITIKDNGLNLLQIEDNGDGMDFDDMPLAFTRHATSKIKSFDDLYRLQSFGFRGEALASAASISRITCTTLNAEGTGGKLTLEASKILSHDKFYPSQKGTVISVKDLFFNTPARLKFIQSKSAEKNQLKKVFQFFLLSYPHVEFAIKWDDADKKIYKPHADYKGRFEEIIFSKKEEQRTILDIEADYEGHRIKGHISRLSSKGNSHKTQFLFVNGRMFFDKSIHQIIMKCAEPLWPVGESGHYLFFFQVPPELLDVNIHPHKTQVKFFKYSMLQSLLSSAIRKALADTGPQHISHQQHNEEDEDLRNYIEDANSFTLSDFKNKFSIERQSSTSINQITSRFFIKETEDTKFLIDAQALLKEFILDNFFSDVRTTPLLVSEPINDNILVGENIIGLLEKLGFELEALTKEKLHVFRTYPEMLNPSSYKSFFYFLLNIIKQQKFESTGQLLNFIENYDLKHFESLSLALPYEEKVRIIEKSTASMMKVDDSILNDLFIKFVDDKLS